MSPVIQTKASSQWQSEIFNLKKSRVFGNSAFIRSIFAKALVFENVYKILPIADTRVELYLNFCMLGPWFVVILEQCLLWTKKQVL